MKSTARSKGLDVKFNVEPGLDHRLRWMGGLSGGGGSVDKANACHSFAITALEPRLACTQASRCVSVEGMRLHMSVGHRVARPRQHVCDAPCQSQLLFGHSEAAAVVLKQCSQLGNVAGHSSCYEIGENTAASWAVLHRQFCGSEHLGSTVPFTRHEEHQGRGACRFCQAYLHTLAIYISLLLPLGGLCESLDCKLKGGCLHVCLHCQCVGKRLGRTSAAPAAYCLHSHIHSHTFTYIHIHSHTFTYIHIHPYTY